MRISDWSSDVCSSDLNAGLNDLHISTHLKGKTVPKSDSTKVQNDIITDLRVDSVFDAGREIERRVTFLADYLISSGARALVLGISGGVDSLVGGCLSQRAVRSEEHTSELQSIMRIPYA